jgi:hypothetical protein
MADDEIRHLEAAIDFFHQFARAVDHFQHVRTFLVPPDFIGKLPAAPVIGLLDLATHA